MIFGYYVVPIPILFTRIFLSLTTGSGNLNNLKGSPYYILQPSSMLFFLICSAADKLFLYSIPCENIQGGPKKRPILFFIPKLCFTIFFPYFSGGKDSRPGRFF